MSWEPDTEENRLGKVRKELEDLKAQTSFLNTPINNDDFSNSLGSGFGQSSFNQGAMGDVVQEVTNVIETHVVGVDTGLIGLFNAIGSFFTIKPQPSSYPDGSTPTNPEPTANTATIKQIRSGVNGQKITLKPQEGINLALINNSDFTKSSELGNLFIGSDIILTGTELITLRFTTEKLYSDNQGCWVVDSTSSGSGSSTSGVLKDPVKVATTANVTNLNFSSPIDGIAMTVGDRFLVKNQTAQKDNGIYIWANGSASTRASDMSNGSVQKEGTMTYVQDGLTQNEILYAINIGGNNITIGTNPNTWGEIGSGSGGGSGAIKSPVKYATTANITLSGEQSIDGTATSTSRVLVKNQTTSSQNGIYVTATGAWARSTDMSTGSTIEGGTMVYVTDGTVNGDNLFGLTTEGTVTVGTGNQAWANLTGSGWVGTATSDLDMNGNDIIDGTGDLRINDDVDLLVHKIKNITSLWYDATGTQSVYATSGGIGIKVPTADTVDFFVNSTSTPKFGITETSVESNVPLDMNLNYIKFQDISSPSAPTGVEKRFLFSDTSNSDHLSVRTPSGVVDLESTGWVGTATSDLNMNGNNIIDNTGDLRINDDIDMLVHKIKQITALWYDATGAQSIYATTGGIGIKVPTNDTIDFFVNSTATPKLGITELSVESNVRLNVNNQAIFFDGTNLKSSILYLSNALNYIVDINNGSHDFFVDDLVTPKFGVTETSIESNVPLNMNLNYVEFQSITAPSHTTATKRYVFQDSTDNHLKIRTNTGLIDLESTGWVGTATSDLNMNGNNIIDNTGDVKFNDDLDLLVHKIKGITSLWYDTTGTQSIYSTVGGIGIKVPTGDTIDFFVNSTATPKFGITETSIESNVPLDMNASKITNVLNPTNPQDAMTLDYFNTNGIWLELNGSTTMTGDINVGNNNIDNVNAVNVVRSDSTARMAIQGGTGTTTQVLFDAVTNVDVRFTEALADRFEIQNSTNTIRSHVDLNMEGNNILNGSIDTGLIDSGILGIARGGTGNSTNTRGDILYSPTSGIWSRLPVGSTNQVLTSDGTDVSWQNASGGGSQTPWTSNIDANSKNLNNLGYLTYNSTGISTSGVQGQLWFDGNDDDFKASTATGLQYNLTENSHITWLEHETQQFDYDVFISNMPNGIVRTKNAGTGVVDTGGAIVSLTANRAYYIPFYIGKQCKIDEIGFLPFNNGMSATATVNYGIYRNRSSGTGTGVSTNPNQYYPETQVANGSFYVASTNEEFKRKTAINQTVYKGWYWIGFNINQSGMQLYAQPYGGGQATSVGNFLNTFGNDTIRPIHGYFTTDSGSIDPTPDEEMTPIDGYAYPVPEIFIKLKS